MAKKPSRRGIEKRITKALQNYNEGDVEDALFNISPVIDVVAKLRYKNKKRVGDRIKAFIFDEQQLIYYLSTQGKIVPLDGVRIVYLENTETNKPMGGFGGELADFIYHNIRCAQTHDVEIDYSAIDLGRNFGIGRIKLEGNGNDLASNSFIISNATVLALILSVICANEINKIRLYGRLILFNKVQLELSTLVGNKDYLMKKLSKLFENK
jgi:hypothetical protein